MAFLFEARLNVRLLSVSVVFRLIEMSYSSTSWIFESKYFFQEVYNAFWSKAITSSLIIKSFMFDVFRKMSVRLKLEKPREFAIFKKE